LLEAKQKQLARRSLHLLGLLGCCWDVQQLFQADMHALKSVCWLQELTELNYFGDRTGRGVLKQDCRYQRKQNMSFLSFCVYGKFSFLLSLFNLGNMAFKFDN
jgi:hypothetical protein